MIVRNREHSLESVIALQMALDPFHPDSMLPAESEKAIRENTVQFVKVEYKVNSGRDIENGKSYDIGFAPLTSASGLMITTDFLTTANHAARQIEDLHNSIDAAFAEKMSKNQEIPRELLQFAVVGGKGNVYLIDPTFYVKDTDHDIALLRVISPHESRPIPYRLFLQEMKQGQPLVASALEKLNYVQAGCSLIQGHVDYQVVSGETIKDCFSATQAGQEGWSGGSIMTPDGHLAGMLLAGNRKEGMIVGAYMNHIFRIVKEGSFKLAKAVLSESMKDINYPIFVQGKIKSFSAEPALPHYQVNVPGVRVGDYVIPPRSIRLRVK